MNPESEEYHAFILRLWRRTEKGRQVWRASLEEPGSEKQRNFASLQSLFEFLLDHTDSPLIYTVSHRLVEEKSNHEKQILQININIQPPAEKD
jgi:hypothetical protein